eukprot:384117-Rhodomonas_salina.3
MSGATAARSCYLPTRYLVLTWHRPTRCPVLSCRMVLPGLEGAVVNSGNVTLLPGGTGGGGGDGHQLWCMGGEGGLGRWDAELRAVCSHPTRCPVLAAVCGTDIVRMCLRAPYALSGADVAHGPTRWSWYCARTLQWRRAATMPYVSKSSTRQYPKRPLHWRSRPRGPWTLRRPRISAAVRYKIVLDCRICYAMPGTDVLYQMTGPQGPQLVGVEGDARVLFIVAPAFTMAVMGQSYPQPAASNQVRVYPHRSTAAVLRGVGY